LQSFVQEYGPLVLIEPPHSGFDWTVWIVPAAVPLLALLAVWIVLRRWRGRAAPAVAQGPGVSPELLARVRHAAEDDGRASRSTQLDRGLEHDRRLHCGCVRAAGCGDAALRFQRARGCLRCRAASDETGSTDGPPRRNLR